MTWFGSEETRLRSQLIAYTVRQHNPTGACVAMGNRGVSFTPWSTALQIAWCESLKCHLKWGKTDDLRGSLDGILPPDEIDKLLTSSHRPHYALQRLGIIRSLVQCLCRPLTPVVSFHVGVIIDNSSCSERKKLSLDNNIARMLTAFAQCERIVASIHSRPKQSLLRGMA